MNDAARFDALIASAGMDDVSGNDALGRIAELVNLSDTLGRKEGAQRALEWCDVFESRGPTDEVRAVLNYFRANAWAALTALRNSDPKLAWTWDQPEIAQQILHLRKTINSPAYDRLPSLYRCQALTNLANQLDAVGRFVEALEYWTRALEIDPTFWMAQGNRGYALIHYAKAHYDRGQAAALLLSAHRDLVAAIDLAAKHPELGHADARDAFERQKAHVEAGIDVAKASKRIRLDGFALGDTPTEQRYRDWCLTNRLFLNPLNDLGSHTIAARDVMTLPDFATKIDEPPSLVGFFNQMKQEFVSARWMYYDGSHAIGTHFSDRDVLLYNTLDYPAYGLSVEKIKMSVRMAYSLFDKIAFFLNRYMDLKVPPNEVSFARIWRTKDNASVRPELEASKNWPLRGLYWLSKDLRDKQLKESTEPDARELNEIRNHLEHKYLKIHEMLVPRVTDPKSPLAWMVDDLAFSIAKTEFDAKALRVLKLARAALMYLSLGMHREEKQRAKTRKDGSMLAPMPLTPWDDEWKQ